MSKRAFGDALSLIDHYDWHEMEFVDRQEALEEITQQLHREYGPNGTVIPMGYDIDDAQWIVWCAYERALETGRVRLELL